MEQNIIDLKLAYSDPEFARIHSEMLINENISLDDLPRVVVCGLLKAGKSSLLNALTNNLEDEYFKTKASRATTTVEELICDGVIYVDTPGLDANSDDDKEAWRGFVNGDQFIFVHNLRIAALDSKEADFLKELHRRRPDISQNMLVALTNVESVEDDIEERKLALQSNLVATLGFCPTLMLTSYTRQLKGVSENKQALIALSGISQLQQKLSSMRSINNLKTTRSSRNAFMRQQLCDLLCLAIKKRQDEKNALQDFRNKAFSCLHKDLCVFINNLRERLSHYKTI
jgi:GTP-binding protein EngB required for normal cell division